MYIKNLKLINFQKHSELNLELTPDVNILWGETRAGKSCIIRALKWILFNEPKGDVIRKYGTKETTVEIIFDNGTILRKIKSDIVNAYEIEKGAAKERYDSIGKNVPKNVVDFLGMFPMVVDKKQLILNIAPQISKPFLLDDSGTFRLKVFNKLTGNHILDLVAQSFNKDILATKKDLKAIAERKEKESLELEEVKTKMQSLDKVINQVGDPLIEAENILKSWEYACNLRDRLLTLNGDISAVEFKLKNIPIIDEKVLDDLSRVAVNVDRIKAFKESLSAIELAISVVREQMSQCPVIRDTMLGNLFLQINKYETVLDLKGNLDSVNGTIEQIRLSMKSVPDIQGLDELDQRIMRFTRIWNLMSWYNNLKDEAFKCKDKWEYLQGLIDQDTKKYKEILREEKKCPTCQSVISDQLLESLEL